MKKLFYATVIACFFSVTACNEKKTESTTTSEDSMNNTMTPDDTMSNQMSTAANNEAVTDAAVTEFVTKALSGGMMEVELGNMAATNGQNERVKSFGTMMVTDHSQAGQELKQLASSSSIAAPTAILPEHQQHIDMMKDKKGAAFDKAYMNMMVKDHEKDISEYTKASQSLSVNVYKDFAAKTLPVLQKHLDSATAIHKRMK